MAGLVFYCVSRQASMNIFVRINLNPKYSAKFCIQYLSKLWKFLLIFLNIIRKREKKNPLPISFKYFRCKKMNFALNNCFNFYLTNLKKIKE